MRFPVNSLFTVLFFSAVVASHSSFDNSHARRSLSRRQGLVGGLVDQLVDVVDPPKASPVTPKASPTEIPSASPASPSTPSHPTGSPSSDSASISTSESSSSSSSRTSSVVTTASSSATSADSPSPSPTTPKGLGDVLTEVLTSLLSPTSVTKEPPTSSEAATSSSVPETSPPVVESSTTPVESTPSSTPASSSPTAEPSSAVEPTPAPTPSSSSPGGLLPTLISIGSSLVSEVTSVVAPITSELPLPSTVPSAEPTVIPSSVISAITSELPLPSSVPSAEPTVIPSSVISAITSELPLPSSVLPSVIPSTTVDPLPSSAIVTSEPPSSSSAPPVPPSSISEPPVPPSSISEPPVPPSSSSEPPVPPSSISTPPVPPSSSVITDAPSITISDPVSSSSAISDIITFPGSNVTSSEVPPKEEPTSVVTSVPETSITIDPGLSFILTESSLALASVPTTTTAQTLTDPDQATTVVESEALVTATSFVATPPLPTGIPNKIYPKDQLSPDTDLTGYTLISILFNRALNWPFVVENRVSSSQIFAWVPVLIATAVGISTNQVKTYALQVYIPTTYKSASDATELGTTWLGYVPSDVVDTLAAEIKAKNSKFYTGVPEGVAQDLAQHVNSGFSLLSVPDPNAAAGADGTTKGAGTTGAVSDSKSRQDAIIGVVTALGGVAILVLVFLVYRSLKRRRELAHRRLSDPPNAFIGARPEGREFDRDSLGGQRRRSFYYAEDSLRGFQGERGEDVQYDHRTAQMSQVNRRNVASAAISAPILRESSMNW